MKKLVKRMGAVFLAVILMVTFIPSMAFAAGDSNDVDVLTGGSDSEYELSLNYHASDDYRFPYGETGTIYPTVSVEVSKQNDDGSKDTAYFEEYLYPSNYYVESTDGQEDIIYLEEEYYNGHTNIIMYARSTGEADIVLEYDADSEWVDNSKLTHRIHVTVLEEDLFVQLESDEKIANYSDISYLLPGQSREIYARLSGIYLGDDLEHEDIIDRVDLEWSMEFYISSFDPDTINQFYKLEVSETDQTKVTLSSTGNIPENLYERRVLVKCDVYDLDPETGERRKDAAGQDILMHSNIYIVDLTESIIGFSSDLAHEFDDLFPGQTKTITLQLYEANSEYPDGHPINEIDGQPIKYQLAGYFNVSIDDFDESTGIFTLTRTSSESPAVMVRALTETEDGDEIEWGKENIYGDYYNLKCSVYLEDELMSWSSYHVTISEENMEPFEREIHFYYYDAEGNRIRVDNQVENLLLSDVYEDGYEFSSEALQRLYTLVTDATGDAIANCVLEVAYYHDDAEVLSQEKTFTIGSSSSNFRLSDIYGKVLIYTDGVNTYTGQLSIIDESHPEGTDVEDFSIAVTAVNVDDGDDSDISVSIEGKKVQLASASSELTGSIDFLITYKDKEISASCDFVTEDPYIVTHDDEWDIFTNQTETKEPYVFVFDSTTVEGSVYFPAAATEITPLDSTDEDPAASLALQYPSGKLSIKGNHEGQSRYLIKYKYKDYETSVETTIKVVDQEYGIVEEYDGYLAQNRSMNISTTLTKESAEGWVDYTDQVDHWKWSLNFEQEFTSADISEIVTITSSGNSATITVGEIPVGETLYGVGVNIIAYDKDNNVIADTYDYCPLDRGVIYKLVGFDRDSNKFTTDRAYPFDVTMLEINLDDSTVKTVEENFKYSVVGDSAVQFVDRNGDRLEMGLEHQYSAEELQGMTIISTSEGVYGFRIHTWEYDEKLSRWRHVYMADFHHQIIVLDEYNDLSLISAKEATCETAGNIAYYTDGKKYYSDADGKKEITLESTIVPAIGHTEIVIPGKDATCSEAGLTEGKKCSVCGEVLTEQEVIPATGHTEVIVAGKDATCSEAGLTEGKKCSVCGEVLAEQEVIPATGHTWDNGVITQEATAEADGVRTYTCSVCGETKTESVPFKATGIVTIDGNQYYYVNGALAASTTDVMKVDGEWYNIVEGQVVGNTVAKNSGGWWAIGEDGKVDFSLTGFAERADNGTTWYVENGKVNFSANGIYKDNQTGKWGYVKGGQLQTGKTDVQKNSAGWWYIDETGYIDFTANTVAKNSSGWWAIENGKVNFSRTGFVERADNGTTWYVENGKINFSANGLYKDSQTGKWGYAQSGQLQTGKTDVQKNSAGWWYIDETGYIDFTANTVAKNSSGWWAIENGKVNFNRTGFVERADNGTIWYVVGGKVNLSATGVYKDSQTGKWGYAKGGQLQTGTVDVQKNSAGWWYIGEDGYVDFTFNGLAGNEFGLWYLENGKVNFSYNAHYRDENGTAYQIVNGKATMLAE